MTLAEITVIPSGTKSPSVSKYVAGAVKILQQEKGIEYEITSMGTILEADLDTILVVARKMHEAAFAGGVQRVMTLLKIDDRRDKALSMRGKVESLMVQLEK